MLSATGPAYLHRCKSAIAPSLIRLITSMTAGPGVETECYRHRRLILELAQSVLQQQKLLEDVVDGHNWSAKRSKYDHRADF